MHSNSSLAEAHSECLPNSARISSFHKPLTPSPIYKTSIEEMTQIIDEQTRLETLAETNQSLQSPSEVFSPPFTSVAQDAVESFCYSRILLSHLGLLSIKTIKKIHAIGDGLRFRRVLKDFDRLTWLFIICFSINSTLIFSFLKKKKKSKKPTTI